jgi:Leucine-rich repeat (LRR) protein
MANTPTGRNSFRSRFGQLNPAFAAAHGIASPSTPANDDKSAVDDKVDGNVGITSVKYEREAREARRDVVLPITASPVQHSPKANQPSKSGVEKAKKAIGRARSTGKLQASDMGLATPLPNILFDFPSLADSVDMSWDTNPNKLKSWESHVAETLVLVDFSDNEGITTFPTMETTDIHTSTNSVERYRSVQIFRARRCQLETFSVTPSLAKSWPQLTTLDLSGNELQGEFPLLYLPPSIRDLDLSGNRLSSLKSSRDPSTSIDLPQLTSLDISMNELASTGISPIMHLPCLQRINLGHNKIYNLNFILKSISSCEKSLTTLNAPKSLLSDLDGQQAIDLTDFVSLTSVDLSENSLCCVPKIPSTLQRLNVNQNSIKNLLGMLEEDGAGELMSSSLVVLQIQRNKLTTLDPCTVAKLVQLNRLDIQFNSLTSLPLELGNLTNLQQMFLEGNNLNALRSSGIRGDLNDTKAILLRLRNSAKADHKANTTKVTGKQSASPPHVTDDTETVSSLASSNSSVRAKPINVAAINVEVGSLLAFHLVGTKSLNYEGKHAHVLPRQMLEELKTSSPDIVQGIETFNIAKNLLQDIESDWLDSLPQLKVLNAQDNRLSSLPTNMRQLRLSQLYLSQNNLTSHAITTFSMLDTSSKSNLITDTLQVLDLSSNCLNAFPPELLRHFKSLRNLNLSRNRITSLRNIVDAPFTPSCSTLEHLNLSDNCIEDLGGDDFPLMLLIGCPKLQTLKLENNELQMVPVTLGMLEKLKSLELRGNPQRMIRYDVLDKSTTYVLQYMRNRMTSKAKERANSRMVQLRLRLTEPTTSTASTPASVPAIVPAATQIKEEKTKEPVHSGPLGVGAFAISHSPQPSSLPAAGSFTASHSPQPKVADTSPTPTPKAIETGVLTRPTKSSASKERPTVRGSTTPRKNLPATPTKASPRYQSGLSSPKIRAGQAPVALGSDSPIGRRGQVNVTPKSEPKGTAVTSPLLKELEKSIEELVAEVDRPGLSEAKRYAVKKNLAMERSKRLKEERRLKQERERSRPFR